MRQRLRRHVEEAIRDFLDPGEELIAAAVIVELDLSPYFRDIGPFGPKKVLALTSSQVLLLEYLGVIGRHVEPVAECPRSHATASLTNICGVRLLRLNLGSGPLPTYRVYFRFGRQAAALVKILESERFEQLRESPSGLSESD